MIGELRDDGLTVIDQTFQFARLTRNEAGHPADVAHFGERKSTNISSILMEDDPEQ